MGTEKWLCAKLSSINSKLCSAFKSSNPTFILLLLHFSLPPALVVSVFRFAARSACRRQISDRPSANWSPANKHAANKALSASRTRSDELPAPKYRRQGVGVFWRAHFRPVNLPARACWAALVARLLPFAFGKFSQRWPVQSVEQVADVLEPFRLAGRHLIACNQHVCL